MQKAPVSSITAFLVGVLIITSGALPAQASEFPTLSRVEGAVAAQSKADPYEAIAHAKRTDPVEFTKKVRLLQQSDALMALFSGANRSSIITYLGFFASTADVATVQKFVADTAGKHFEVSGTTDRPVVKLVDGSPVATRGYKCWKAYVAAYAWFAATGAPCGAAGAMTAGGAGVACAMAFWGVGTLPEWNKACK